ncbi:hypothetical protein FQN57_007132 [Myotisia sp. PD_48]|nr:hypothetical protein FQN57_007132 [Myotisia sp. PD_48]
MSLLHTSDSQHLPRRPQIQPKYQNNANIASSFYHLAAGAAGGAITALLTSPLDVLRTRLQSDFYRPPVLSAANPSPSSATLINKPLSSSPFRQTFQILSSIYRIEGWRGLFRGLGPNLVGVVPASAIKFYTYGNAKRIISDSQIFGPDTQNALGCHILSAMSAGMITGTATSPIWVVKTRLQLDRAGSSNARRYRNSFHCASEVLRREGPRGFYRGLTASYLGSLETMFHLALYEQLKIVMARRNSVSDSSANMINKNSSIGDRALSWLGMGGAAGVSKLISGVIAYPHEVIRTRLRQSPMSNGQPKYTGIVQCFRLLRMEEGVRALYGGLVPHLLRSIPSAAITLGVYEAVLEGLKMLNPK